MERAIAIFVFNADQLLADRQGQVRLLGFELEQAVNDEAESGGKLVEGRAFGGLADGMGEGEGGIEQRLAEALVLRVGLSFRRLSLISFPVAMLK